MIDRPAAAVQRAASASQPGAATATAAQTAADSPLPDRSVVPGVWSRVTGITVERGEGSWLITTEGERYLDYTSGIGVTNTGHAHPRVAAAIAAQATRLLHGQQNIVYHEPGLRLYDRLRSVLPGGPWQAFLSNSGAEAVEAAVKLARAATKRPVVLVFSGGFHGRTAQTMALTTAKNVYRADFEPLPGSVHAIPYPYCYRAARGPHVPDAACSCPWEEQLDLILHTLTYPEHVAAVIVEPVLGEGGYVVPPPTFLPRLRQITRELGILLVVDEVQTGMGRTGELFAVRHWDVEPDILVFAKAVASGLPLSGIIAREDLVARWRPGAHGGTFGGNVVACAAANATFEVIRDEHLVENARDRGAQLVAGLRGLAPRYPSIGDVRGLGLMVALEFVQPRVGDGRVPNPEMTKKVVAAALERRLILLTAGAYGQVIRMIPPLVTTADEVDLAIRILDQALAAAA